MYKSANKSDHHILSKDARYINNLIMNSQTVCEMGQGSYTTPPSPHTPNQPVTDGSPHKVSVRQKCDVVSRIKLSKKQWNQRLIGMFPWCAVTLMVL